MDECSVQLRLIGATATAFKRLCALEVRRPSQEARFLIVRELEKRGLTINEADPPSAVAGADDPTKSAGGLS
jgi:hypothetical protein